MRWQRSLRHSVARDAGAIAAHYDLSSDFYATFLDRRMVYTCAYFRDLASDDIDGAQLAKLDHVCRKLRLSPGQSLLDLGCGWGGLVIHAARHYGVRARGVTLSRAQADYAREAIAREGLEARARVDLRHAMELDPGEERYDRIAAVGVLEHIGVRHHRRFFTLVRRLLHDDGVLLNHSITNRPGAAFDGGSAFMFRIVFPDAELVPVSQVLAAMEASGFEVADVEDLRWHYHRTCTLWTRRLQAARDEARRHVNESVYRTWLAYLAGATLSFEEGWAQLYQTVAVPLIPRPSPLPPTRDDLYVVPAPTST